MFQNKINKDPFRVFFSAGIVLGILGIAPWVKLLWNESGYPLIWHKFIMINGFMLAFVVGFLMTAIPRFTKTPFASTYEVWSGFVLLIVSTIALAFTKLGTHHLFVSLLCIFLIVFGLKRFLKRAENPPYTFLFVGISIVLWFISNLLQGLAALDCIDLGRWSVTWSTLQSEGILLGLIIGVGGRLIPGILGWEEIVSHQRKVYEQPISFIKVVPKSIMALVLLFFGSYFLQNYLNELALWIRLSVILYIAFKMWRVYRLPPKRTRLSMGIWLTTWLFIFSAILPLCWNYGYSHSAHGYFISGFSLLTLLIATRVTLAHNSQGTALESTSKMIPTFVFLLVLSAATRITAIIWPNQYTSHLAYASILWLAAIFIWSVVLIPEIFCLAEFKSEKKNGV
ncbi:MAG TPA: NnrS family protein [Oligoflexia bacterium]|nr:NnrS family protein [Oligoflexia bacterium]HMR25825.1 NnrS family protein [Oligoflexia bacterium]